MLILVPAVLIGMCQLDQLQQPFCIVTNFEELSLLLFSKKGNCSLAVQTPLLEFSLLKDFSSKCVEGESHGRFAYVCHISTDIWIFSFAVFHSFHLSEP
jgi:hypothetical protein